MLFRSGFKFYVSAASHAEMVAGLVSRGFRRFLVESCPMQDEPLALHDTKGREWSAMSATFVNISKMPNRHLQQVLGNTDECGKVEK